MKINIAIAVASLLVAGACSPGPEPIHYGADGCEYCKMTIVDPRFSAEAVTSKGRVYKFDAIECLARYVAAHPETRFESLLVADYLHPDQWLEAQDGHFLMSKAIPSPMGAFLSAYQDEASAGQMREEKGGNPMKWSEIMQLNSR